MESVLLREAILECEIDYDLFQKKALYTKVPFTWKFHTETVAYFKTFKFS